VSPYREPLGQEDLISKPQRVPRRQIDELDMAATREVERKLPRLMAREIDKMPLQSGNALRLSSAHFAGAGLGVLSRNNVVGATPEIGSALHPMIILAA
jgi:hypothetical protein